MPQFWKSLELITLKDFVYVNRKSDDNFETNLFSDPNIFLHGFGRYT